MIAFHRSRRSQAMVEYIVLVGLIAIGLIAVVSVAAGPGSFGYAVDEAIQGTTRGVDRIGTNMGGGGSGSGSVGGATPVGRTDRGIDIVRQPDGTLTTSSGDPYIPATHGTIP